MNAAEDPLEHHVDKGNNRFRDAKNILNCGIAVHDKIRVKCLEGLMIEAAVGVDRIVIKEVQLIRSSFSTLHTK